ncbi:aquaporin-8-like [Engraulis encrasicolus]|uniref:aquaporin-8-like n=1 Tax=Engraulis encrasicolus TaxID=184585 RepID=UPI002FD4B0CE
MSPLAAAKETHELSDSKPTRAGAGERGPRWARTKYDRYLLPCVAEFFGTALFVFSGCASVIENSPGTGSLQPAVAHGLALSISIAITAGISGGHMNPAVTLGVTVAGGLNAMLLVPYWLAQFCGAMAGAGLARFYGAMSGAGLARAVASSHESYVNASGGAFNAIQGNHQVGAAIIAELVMTFYLVLAVCLSAVNHQSKTPLAPFCIGLTLCVGILGAGAVSGACLNPARAFGPAVAANYWSYHWVYWVAPLGAGLLVGVVLRTLLGDTRTRLTFRKLEASSH